MLLDDKLVIMDAKAITSIGTYSGTTIDLGSMLDAWGSALTPDYSPPGNLWLNCIVQTAVTSGGAATVQPIFCSATSETGTLNAAMTGSAIAKASLTAGAEVMRTPLPKGLNRYLNMQLVVAVSALTAGKFDCYITRGVDTVS